MLDALTLHEVSIRTIGYKHTGYIQKKENTARRAGSWV
jgi:hypothetical protein